jgi:HAD superfamily hydrolase (TIGR01484 family)
MKLPRIVIFDMDGTLAESKQRMTASMAELLAELLARTKIAIMSGGGFSQFEQQFLASFAPGTPFDNHSLFPTSGAAFYRLEHGAWKQVYAEAFTESEAQEIHAAIAASIAESGIDMPERTYGAVIDDRGSEITFSALGQRAPLHAKSAWDPTGEKKNTLRAAVAELIPDLEVRSGGSTSVDITHRGIDKAYGMRQLAEQTGIPLDDMLFVGDRLDPDGNDYPVLALGVRCHAVTGWEDTAAFLEELIPTL